MLSIAFVRGLVCSRVFLSFHVQWFVFKKSYLYNQYSSSVNFYCYVGVRIMVKKGGGMSKGKARIALHSKRHYLVESLRDFKSLQEIRDCLVSEGVAISLSSLYRFLVNDMREEYENYLRITGRGLVRNRNGLDTFTNRVISSAENLMLPVAKKESISNPGELNKFLKKRC